MTMITPPAGPRSRSRRLRAVPVTIGAACLLLLAGCAGAGGPVGSGGSTSDGDAAATTPGQFGTEYENTGTGPMVAPTIPTTPSVPTYFGQLMCSGGRQADPEQPAPDGCTRVFSLTALAFTQQIANFPMKTATVWGYQRRARRPPRPGPR